MMQGSIQACLSDFEVASGFGEQARTVQGALQRGILQLSGLRLRRDGLGNTWTSSMCVIAAQV